MSPRKKPGVAVRINGDGTKSYEIRWRENGGRAGRNLSHSFSRERDAVDARNRILAAGGVCFCAKHHPDGSAVARAPGLLPEDAPATTLTFGQYAERHIRALTGVGEGYRRDALRDIRRHLQGVADKPIDGITKLDVAEMVRGMETGEHPWLGGKPLAPATIRRQLAQARGVMEAAVNDGLVDRNPFRGHRLQRPMRDADHGMTFLTPAEWKILEAELPEGVYRDLCGFLVGSGLRWGEATALTVGNVDLLASPPRVFVGQAWKSDGKGGYVLGPPKSARSRRTVTLTSWVRDLMVAHVAAKGDDEFVFTTPRGSVIRPQNFWKRTWAPALRRAQANGLEKSPTVHSLRHSHVSWLLAEGRPMHEVSRRVGHNSLQVTDSIYAHLLPQAATDAVSVLEKFRTRPAD